jgi:hypothetical protein
MAALGPERVIAPPASPRAVARSDEAIAVVTSSATGGTRAVLTGFDGAPLRTVILSDAPSTAAAAASDGHSFLFTWMAGGAFHAALLQGDALQPIDVADPPPATSLLAVFDGARYVVFASKTGLIISTAGVVEERFPLAVPLSAATVSGGRVVVAWTLDDGKLEQLDVAELLPDHSLAAPVRVKSQVSTQLSGGGLWLMGSVGLAPGYVAWARLPGYVWIGEGSRLAADLTPIDAHRLSANISLGYSIDSVAVAPLPAGFLTVWQYKCGCFGGDGVWGALIDASGQPREEFKIRRGGVTPFALALPDQRAAVVYGADEGVILRVFDTAPRRRVATR